MDKLYIDKLQIDNTIEFILFCAYFILSKAGLSTSYLISLGPDNRHALFDLHNVQYTIYIHSVQLHCALFIYIRRFQLLVFKDFFYLICFFSLLFILFFHLFCLNFAYFFTLPLLPSFTNAHIDGFTLDEV